MTVNLQLPQAPQVDMREALQAANDSIQTREPFSASPSSFLSRDAVAAHQEPALPSCSRKLRFRGALGCKVILGAFASAAAIAVLISLCATVYLRTPPFQLAGRRLSGRGLPKSTTGLGACGATSGDYPGDNTQASVGGEELEPPPQKKAKLDDAGPDAHTVASSQLQTSGSRHEVSPSAAANSAAAAAATNLEAHSPSESHLPPKVLMAAQGLISLGDEQASFPPDQPGPGPDFQQQALLAPASQQRASPPPPPHQRARPSPPPQQQEAVAEGSSPAASAALPELAAGEVPFAPQPRARPSPLLQQQEAVAEESPPGSAAPPVLAAGEVPSAPQQQADGLLVSQQQEAVAEGSPLAGSAAPPVLAAGEVLSAPQPRARSSPPPQQQEAVAEGSPPAGSAAPPVLAAGGVPSAPQQQADGLLVSQQQEAVAESSSATGSAAPPALAAGEVPSAPQQQADRLLASQQQEQPPPASQQLAPPAAVQQQVPLIPALQQQAQLVVAFRQQAQPPTAFPLQALLPSAFQQPAQPPTASQQRAELLAVLQQQAQLLAALQQQAQILSVFLQQALLAPAPPQQPQLLLAFQQQAQPPASQQQALLAPAFQQQAQPSPAAQQQAQHVLAFHQQAQPHSAPEQQAATEPTLEPEEKDAPESPMAMRKTVWLNDELEIIDPLEEWEPPPLFAAGGRPILEHAFSRLPRVPHDEPSDYKNFFSSKRASSEDVTTVKAPKLQKISALLRLEALSPSHMRILACAAEHLVSHLTNNENRRLKDSPVRAAAILGLRFLMLDMTVSILQLLEVPRSGPWWDKMVSRIERAHISTFTKWQDKLPSFNFKLVTRLTLAIQILKSGHRPDPKDLVHLKRCLFCCKFSPLRFLKPGWNPWREANRQFYLQFDWTPEQIQPAQLGSSHQG
ncbi:hypothetical protein Emag_006934 [Eimeria magna]